MTLKIIATVTQTFDSAAPEAVEHLQPTTQREGQQDGDFNSQPKQAKARSGDAVVGGLLVRRQLDSPGKLFGNRIATCCDVGNLSPGKPNANCDHQ